MHIIAPETYICIFQFLDEQMPTFSALCKRAYVENLSSSATMTSLKQTFWQ